MPMLNVSQFDSEPSVGDKVRVEGVVKSIDSGTGDVEVSYDKVESMGSGDAMSKGDGSTEHAQTLDEALAENFSKDQ